MAEIFRKSITSSGKIILAGKDAISNEELIKQVNDNEIVLHTKQAGSPFVNIKNSTGVLDHQKSSKINKISEVKEDAKKLTKQDIKEAAIFCAKYSQAWKKARTKRDIEVHYFLGKMIFKDKTMKAGTFGVIKNNKIIVKKDEIK